MYVFFLGGHYAGVETIKTRLLPWLGTCFSCATSGRHFEDSLSLTQVCRKSLLRKQNSVNLYLQENSYNVLLITALLPDFA